MTYNSNDISTQWSDFVDVISIMIIYSETKHLKWINIIVCDNVCVTVH